MNGRLLPVFACLVLIALVGCGPVAEERWAALEAADDRRIAALVAADTAQLAPLLSADLRYVHSNGMVDDKASFLDLVGSGRTEEIKMTRIFSILSPAISHQPMTSPLPSRATRGASERFRKRRVGMYACQRVWFGSAAWLAQARPFLSSISAHQ